MCVLLCEGVAPPPKIYFPEFDIPFWLLLAVDNEIVSCVLHIDPLNLRNLKIDVIESQVMDSLSQMEWDTNQKMLLTQLLQTKIVSPWLVAPDVQHDPNTPNEPIEHTSSVVQGVSPTLPIGSTSLPPKNVLSPHVSSSASARVFPQLTRSRSLSGSSGFNNQHDNVNAVINAPVASLYGDENDAGLCVGACVLTCVCVPPMSVAQVHQYIKGCV